MKISICKNLISLFYCLAVRDFQITLIYSLQIKLFYNRIGKIGISFNYIHFLVLRKKKQFILHY